MNIITDSDFNAVIKKNNYVISCWTLPSWTITLKEITHNDYGLDVIENGCDVFLNDKGIYFRIQYDYIQKIVALYFFNGTRGWYLHSTDIFVLDPVEINNSIARLISVRKDMMMSVFSKAMMNEDSLSEYYNLNEKHYYAIENDPNDPNLRHLYLTPKKVWSLSETFSELNQSDYKFLETLGLHFVNVHRATFDVTVLNLNTVISELKKNNVVPNVDFDSYVSIQHKIELSTPNTNLTMQQSGCSTSIGSCCGNCDSSEDSSEVDTSEDDFWNQVSSLQEEIENPKETIGSEDPIYFYQIKDGVLMIVQDTTYEMFRELKMPFSYDSEHPYSAAFDGMVNPYTGEIARGFVDLVSEMISQLPSYVKKDLI